jgi:hypothetical protein
MPMQNIAGAGQLLPFAQAPYPVGEGGAPYRPPTNKISLSPAQSMLIPAGGWIVSATGAISALQYLDPFRQEWVNYVGPGAAFVENVYSDGVSWRVNNLSDSAYGALITAAGSGYVQASTTVTAGTGNSTWQPIIGGALGTFTVVAGGAGYSMPPLVFIPAPPYPGIPATATAALTTGAVSAITIRTAGAGYLTAPPITILPVQNDPALLAGTITSQATATVALTGAGTLTGLLLVNFGQLLTTAPTLTVNGVGASATATTNPATVVAAANDIITLQPL